MADELIDVYNEQNESLEAPLMKSEVHRRGLWHRASHIWIYNTKGEILLQLRAAQKDYYPNVWDVSAAGHIAAGEEPLTAAIRELEEELGLRVTPNALELYTIAQEKNIYKKILSNEFQYIYFLRFDGDIATLKIQPEEVEEIRWFGVDFLENDLELHPVLYLPPLTYYREIIAEVRRRSNNLK